MGLSESVSKRRSVAVINHGFLFLSLLLSMVGHYSGWTSATIVCFWMSVVVALGTFYPLHIRTGFWRLAHAKLNRMDEREIQQALEALRHAYVLFAISALLVILSSVVLGLSDNTHQLVVFWVLLYLAHTLPSSILAWTVTRVPTQTEE
jgi:hypothetical protein